MVPIICRYRPAISSAALFIFRQRQNAGYNFLHTFLPHSRSTNLLMTTDTSIPTLPSRSEAFRIVAEVARSDADVIQCGSLACQHDSMLKTGAANIVSHCAFIEDVEKKSSSSKKKKKKGNRSNGSSPASSPPKVQYAVVLNDSIFFPAGGGQPSDSGTLAFDGGPTLNVMGGKNVDGICVLSCSSDTKTEDVTEALSLPTETKVMAEIDWDRRFDYMTQHSAQHLISTMALRRGVDTHSFRLNADGDVSYLNFAIPETKSVEEIREIMRKVEVDSNEAIRQNYSMKPLWIDPENPPDDVAGKLRSRLLPPGFSGKLRLVQIGGDLDLNTCCGTHVPSLGMLQAIKFFKQEKVNASVYRVRFAAASRLLRAVDSMYTRTARVTSLLSCTEEEQGDRLEKVLEDRREGDREIDLWKERHRRLAAEGIVAQINASEDGVFGLDLKDVDIAYMGALADNVLAKTGSEGIVILLVASDLGSFYLSGDVKVVNSVGKGIAEVFVGRGGGRAGKFQGKGSLIKEGFGKAMEILRKAVESENVRG